MLYTPFAESADRPGLFAASLSMFGPRRYRCQAADAMKARGVKPEGSSGRRELLDDFVTGLVKRELDLVEFPHEHQASGYRSRRQVHAGVRSWVEHAAATYISGCAREADPALLPTQPWMYRFPQRETDAHGIAEYRIKAWGRAYSSADGTIRELRIPVNRLGARERTDAERAIAVRVAAKGVPGEPPAHIRVREVGLLEPGTRILFEGDQLAARELYREHGRDPVMALVAGGPYEPGAACADCAFAPACPALPRVDGALGVAGASRPQRSWSATNGRGYAACPARDYLRRLRIPPDYALERSISAETGRALHDYLARRHATANGQPCSPNVPADWNVSGRDLSESELDLGRRQLRHHAEVCPFGRGRIDLVHAEPDRSFFDADAGVVLIASPDLLYLDGGSWVWREVKSHRTPRARFGDRLTQYPQLALAVLIIASGGLGPAAATARIELESLWPDFADIEIIDPFDPDTVSAARRVVRNLVALWHTDDRYDPRPGPSCRSCEVARWCPAAEREGAA